MSSTSKPYADGTTEPSEQEEAGSRRGALVIWHSDDLNTSIPLKIRWPNELRFHLWEFGAKARHEFGRHTWVDIEDWSQDKETTTVSIIGQGCWLCPARR